MTITSRAPAPAEPPPAAPPPSPSRVPGYVFGGIAVAGLGTGVAFFLQHRSLVKENDDLCGRPDVICDSRREGVATRQRNVAIATGAVGVLSAAASIYFFTRGPSSVALGPTGVTYRRAF